MQFRELAAAFERIEATKKRLETRSILAELLRPLHREELARTVYLAQGLLRPEYEGVELGVADSLARRAVARVTATPEAEVGAKARASGDLGTTAEELAGRVQRLDRDDSLTIGDVYDELTRIARESGEGSQEQKIRRLEELLRRATPLEARYLVRFVTGTLRVGVREMTILDALAERFAPGSKEARQRIEEGFNVTSDLGAVASAIDEGGLPALAELKAVVGRPIRPMLAERSSDLAEILKRLEGRAALEYKYDGLRVQAHVPRSGPARLFSRRLEEISAQFPDLAKALPLCVAERPVILEGECVPIDPDTDEIRPFQDVARRRGRKHELERAQEEVPVVLFAFDLLLAGRDSTADRPFPERRARLESAVRPSERIRLASQRIVGSVEEAQRFFDEAVAAGAEGIMAKSLAEKSRYRAGARGFWWIKYKREYVTGLADSIDGVVVGAFSGRGRRGGLYGALLLAVYDPKLDRFESFCKVGSGFDDAALAELPKRLHPFVVRERPPNVETGLTPDQWLTPGLVLEVRGAELTQSPIHRAGRGDGDAPGLALRFPRFTGRYRDDKGPTEATTTAELLDLWSKQRARGPGPGAPLPHRPKE